MAATQHSPGTISPDRGGDATPPMSGAEKEARYREVRGQIAAVLKGGTDLVAGMSTIACLLDQAFPHFFWTGFYRRVGPSLLRVGPYQGTMGCLDIEFGRGVCGTCAERRQRVIVEDVHEFPGHIACDAASVSEIVVPVLDAEDRLIAVLDVDSTRPAAFDEVDGRWLEEIVTLLRGLDDASVVWR